MIIVIPLIFNRDVKSKAAKNYFVKKLLEMEENDG